MKHIPHCVVCHQHTTETVPCLYVVDGTPCSTYCHTGECSAIYHLDAKATTMRWLEYLDRTAYHPGHGPDLRTAYTR